MLLGNGRLNITIEMPAKILKTNATYQSGKKLALIDLSFAALLEKNSAVGKLLDNPRLIKKYANRLKETKDCRIELNTPVAVEFK